MAIAQGSTGGLRFTGHTTLVLALGTGDEVSTVARSASAQEVQLLEHATLSVAQLAHLPEMAREFDMEAWDTELTALQ